MSSHEEEMVRIDGSHGEGGGQVLRTALAISTILEKPLTVHCIRSRRKKPGLRPQHLKGVEALAQISEAMVEGAQIGSGRVTFVPGKIHSGEYCFKIGNGRKTAGAITLLLQTLLPPLCLAHAPSRLTLVGGTHVPWSPPFHYFAEVLCPTLATMGVVIETDLERWGWYPEGGGHVRVRIGPRPVLKTISLLERGPIKKIRGLSATSNLPRHIADRQRDEAKRRIEGELREDAEISVLYDAPSVGRGSFFFLVIESEGSVAGFSSLGEMGKRAEEVAGEVVNALKDYISSDGCVDPYLADQIIPFMVFTEGNSSFTTTRITDHLLTNLWVVQQFTAKRISVTGEKGERGRIDFFNK